MSTIALWTGLEILKKYPAVKQIFFKYNTGNYCCANLYQEMVMSIDFSVRRRSRRTFSTHFEIFLRRVDGVVIYFFNSDFKFFDDASEFSVCPSMFFYFLLKVHVSFSSVFYRAYRAVVTSSRHQP